MVSDNGLDNWTIDRGRLKAVGAPTILKQGAQRRKGKVVISRKSKGKGKAHSQAKSKRKTMEFSAKGASKKKLLVSTTQDIERA